MNQAGLAQASLAFLLFYNNIAYERDFGGYQNKRIHGTEYFLLTQGSTLEKVQVLNDVARVLGMVPGSVEIEAIMRSAGRN